VRSDPMNKDEICRGIYGISGKTRETHSLPNDSLFAQ
jgi:hypothetical protein